MQRQLTRESPLVSHSCEKPVPVATKSIDAVETQKLRAFSNVCWKRASENVLRYPCTYPSPFVSRTTETTGTNVGPCELSVSSR